jgi:DNA-binding FadR family transcriptional regulator
MRTLAVCGSIARPRDAAGAARPAIKELIFSGVLSPGDALPSTREVATGLSVSRNTAVNATTA